MAIAETQTITVTTDASGDVTDATMGPFTGYVQAFVYTKDDFDNGVDFTITSVTTGQTIWTESNVNASKTVAPRQATHTTAGVASTYDGTRAVEDRVYLVNENISVVVAQGGNAKSGTFRVIVTP